MLVLVGGLEHEIYDFPYIGNVIIPTDFHIFQRGWSSTNQLWLKLFTKIPLLTVEESQVIPTLMYSI